MSRRIQQSTDLKERELVMRALELADIGYRVDGNYVHMTSGALNHATLDLKTGNITGDSDYGHTENAFGLLRQWYGEALVRRECAKNGTTITERETNDEGDIVLTWQLTG